MSTAADVKMHTIADWAFSVEVPEKAGTGAIILASGGLYFPWPPLLMELD